MVSFIFTKFAERKFLKLPNSTQRRIGEKLQELKGHEDIFSALKRLHHFEPATHRLRIGSYRLILELKTQSKNTAAFWILDVGDRKEIYR